MGLELFGPVLDEMMCGTYRNVAEKPVQAGSIIRYGFDSGLLAYRPYRLIGLFR